jgi:protein gp37
MGANSNIEWTDHTLNPWVGCTKVSPGCAHCYAETLMDTRYGRVKWGAGNPRSRTSAANWKLPLRWNREAARYPDQCTKCGTRLCMDAQVQEFCPAQHNEAGEFDPSVPVCGGTVCRNVRPRVFCASLADWLDDEVPVEWMADLLELIRATPQLDWLLLTKRPQNWRRRIEAITTTNVDLAAWLLAWLLGPGEFGAGPFDGLQSPGAPANVWLGTTVEDQERADERIPALVGIPARVRFLSCEPLLEHVDVSDLIRCAPRMPTAIRTATSLPALSGTFYRDYALKNHDPFEWYNSPVESYRSLWESINGVGSWAQNPWCWVIEFRRVAP